MDPSKNTKKLWIKRTTLLTGDIVSTSIRRLCDAAAFYRRPVGVETVSPAYKVPRFE